MMIMLVFKVMKSSVTVWNKALVLKDDEGIGLNGGFDDEGFV